MFMDLVYIKVKILLDLETLVFVFFFLKALVSCNLEGDL